MTHSSLNSVNGEIPLINVTRKTVDISEYFDFGYMKKYNSRIMMVYILVNLECARDLRTDNKIDVLSYTRLER